MAAVFSVVPFALAGCGSSHKGVTVTRSPFVGSYTGAYTATGNRIQGGTITETTDNLGNISGTAYDDSVRENATVTGKVDNVGTLTMNLTFPNAADLIALSGTVSLATNGHLTGNLQDFDAPSDIAMYTVVPVTLDLRNLNDIPPQ